MNSQGTIATVDPETGEITTWTEAEYYKQRDFLLVNWSSCKEQLDEIKEAEMRARKAVVDFTSNPNKKSGMQYHSLENGWYLEIDRKVNLSLVKDDNNKIDDNAIRVAMDELQHVENGIQAGQKCVKWKLEIVDGEYKKLTGAPKEILSKIVVESIGAPTIKICPPKVKVK